MNDKMLCIELFHNQKRQSYRKSSIKIKNSKQRPNFQGDFQNRQSDMKIALKKVSIDIARTVMN